MNAHDLNMGLISGETAHDWLNSRTTTAPTKRRYSVPQDRWRWLDEHLGADIAGLAALLDGVIASEASEGDSRLLRTSWTFPPTRMEQMQSDPVHKRPQRPSSPGWWELLILMAESELAAALHDATGLTTKQRALVYMQGVGLTYQEMARLMHVTPGTVVQQLHRARQKLLTADSAQAA